MDITQIIQAAFLGVVEGLTEFIPVSSTAHLIVMRDVIGFNGPPGFVFEIAIQLGSILAVFSKFWRRIFFVGVTFHSKPESRQFVLRLLVAFLPAVIIGAGLHHVIEQHLFRPIVIGITLLLGGFLIIYIENKFKTVKFETVDDISLPTALKIGIIQTIALIPGVSRSGASIMGALTLGVSRQAAAEFSFFLAIPTMLAATVYDLYKNRADLHADSLGLIAIGFLTAFISALFVVNLAINFVSKNGFKPFAYYRIVVGTVIIVLVGSGNY